MKDMNNTDKMEQGYEEVCTGCGETVCLSKEEHDQRIRQLHVLGVRIKKVEKTC
jgi:hypothetical protein